MITIISGTNRLDSKALVFANTFHQLYTAMGEEAQILDLSQLSHDFFFPEMYGAPATSIRQVKEQYVDSADKFHFILPEYNGSFSGAVKLWLDALSVTGDFKKVFGGKRAALTGIATGRAGNLRGLEHFTSILHYLNVVVMPSVLPVSGIKNMFNEQNDIHDEATLKVLQQQAENFAKF